MVYKCKPCHKKDIDSVLKQDGPGWFTCPQCHRDVEMPDKSVPGATSAQTEGLLGANGKVKSHGYPRIEAKSDNAYQPDMPEFGEP